MLDFYNLNFYNIIKIFSFKLISFYKNIKVLQNNKDFIIINNSYLLFLSNIL